MIARRLGFGAQSAAARFARRYSRSRLRALLLPWLPLVLRWKRAGKVPVVYHSHVHRHFGLLPGAGPRRAHATPLAVTSTFHRVERSIVERPRPDARDSAPSRREMKTLAGRKGPDAVRAVQGPNASLEPVARVTKERPTAATPFPAPATRAFRTTLPTSGSGVGAAAAMEPTRTSIRGPGRLFMSEPLVLQAHRPPQTKSAMRSDAAAVFATTVVHGSDLLWRAPTETSLRAAPGIARDEARAAPAESLSRAALPTGKPPSAVASASPAPARSMSLDRALVDRLADDVIRRVERRARIERERRGL
jgi:hypothetical protein